ncbi:MAG TPA: HDOD domain-containing protein [Aquabacterium sp.]|uniref:HDOD domain-containing protein n=1 Tax=Aquabacterium sp. TaxID=1872578 RepID=UPI002E35BB99|nr:HDOD domain-containing protein [Aquabacterium sp.]HEX5371155.1 HDOD domain-containing protein [Aquabacterium sp.]
MFDIDAVDRDFDAPGLRALIKDLRIPPRPTALVDMQAEIRREDPRMHVLAQIVASDVAMSATLLKVANSPWAGLSRQAETVQQAFMLLGLARCEHILTEIALRQVLPTDGPALYRFWDVSSKRSHAMAVMAARVGVSSSQAQTFGLFADVGIPLLAHRFSAPSYIDTLATANADEESLFTDVERSRHPTDHAMVGAVLARSWGVSQTVTLAVRFHHDYSVFEARMPDDVQILIALCLVIERVIQRYQGLNAHVEWTKGGEEAMRTLGLTCDDYDDWCDELHERFGQEH